MHSRAAQVVGLQDVMPTMLEAAGVPIPGSVNGRSVLPIMRGESPKWREFLHGEHSPSYRQEDGMQYLTDGLEKFIWYTQTGQEQFFDLRGDPNECRDLIRSDAHAPRVELWRKRLIAQLKPRPEGFSDGQKLVVGRKHDYLIPR
jgi:arylsulfatase A-like enzyme